jgi:trehalose/maltose hydrolase-like predicted phosphorylase
VLNEDLVNLPNWLVLQLRIDGEDALRLADLELLDYRHELDIRTATVRRFMRFRDRRGRQTTLQSRRFVSMANPHHAAIEWILVPDDWSGHVEVITAIDGRLEIAAVKGSYASVIGGAPAAATVFARDVKARTENDDRVARLRAAVQSAGGAEAGTLRAELMRTIEQVHAEKLREVADEFDAIHTIQRALSVGSVDRIVAARELRPYIIDTLERGMARYAVPVTVN